jgi:hypothetical protein
MSLSDFRVVSKARATQPTTIVEVVKEAAATVVRTFANRECGCTSCSSTAYQSLHSLFLAVVTRHALYGCTDDEAEACAIELHRAADRVHAIEDFCRSPYVEGGMQ